VDLHKRGVKTIAYPVEYTGKENLHGAVLEHVEIGSQLMTDESTRYAGIGRFSWGTILSLRTGPQRSKNRRVNERNPQTGQAMKIQRNGSQVSNSRKLDRRSFKDVN